VAGTVNINSSKALGIATTTFKIDGGTTIDNTSGAAITLTNNQPMTINGDFTFTGNADGTHDLNLGAGAKTLGTAAGTSRTNTVNAGTLTIGGVIGNGTTVSNLVKSGSGTLTLTGANTFSGTTTINNGKVKLGGATALQNSAYDTTGSTGAIGLDVTGYATPTLGGLAGSVDLATAITGYSGVIGLTLNPQAGATVTYDGVIADGSGAMTLTKSGTGTQILTGPNSYSGGTTNTAGTLALGADNVLGTGLLVMNGGTLGASGGARVLTNAVNLKVASTINTTGGAITLAGAVTNTSTLTVIGANTLALTNATIGQINIGINGSSAGNLIIPTNGVVNQGGNVTLNMDAGSSLVITNGGVLKNGRQNNAAPVVGASSGSSNNYALVSGAGSLLLGVGANQSFSVGAGANSWNNRMVVNDGASATYTSPANALYFSVGGGNGSYSNTLLFDNSTFFGNFTYANTIGTGAGAHDNSLIVTNGAVMTSPSGQAYVVPYAVGGVSSYNNSIIVAGTNASGQKATLNFGHGNQFYTLLIGYGSGSYSNYLVVGAGGQAIGYNSASAYRGSMWIGWATNAFGNYAVVTNGGAVYIRGTSQYLGVGSYAPACSNNYLVVDGAGSYVSVSNACAVWVGVAPNAVGNYILLRNGGLLEGVSFSVGYNDPTTTGNAITNSGGILQFTTATPTIAITNAAGGNGIVMDSGTLSYRGIQSGTLPNLTNNTGTAQTGLFTWPAGTTNAFRLNNCIASNSVVGGYTFAYNASDGKQYARLELVNGMTELRGQPVTIGAGGTIYFDQTAATLRSGVTLAAGATIAVGATNGLSVTVTGGLTVGSEGTLVLPEGLAKDAEFKLISVSGGILTGEGNLSSWTDTTGWKYKLVLKNTTEVWVAPQSPKGTMIQIL
jgi:autotransporter-associated beta strand protein